MSIRSSTRLRRLRRVLLVLLLGAPAAGRAEDLVVVIPPRPTDMDRVAADELVRFLAPITRERVRAGGRGTAADAYVLLEPRAVHGLAAEEVLLASTTWKGKPAVSVAAGAGGILHATSRLLEHFGYLFELSGEQAPAPRERLPLDGIDVRERPAVPERGLRMHLNFPMDQSGYSLPEWLTWVERAARLRLNALIFHFYAGHPWVEWEYAGVRPAREDFFAGHFSVGPYLLPPDLPGRALIANRRRFAPPELEDMSLSRALYRATRERVRAVMAHARRRGLRCIVALEPFSPRVGINDVDRLAARLGSREAVFEEMGAARVAAAIASYPEADEVQLISVEGSNDAPGDAGARARLEQELRAHPALPPEVWAALPAAGEPEHPVALATLRFFVHARRMLERPAVADALRRRRMQTSLALYLPDPAVLARLLPAVVRLVPRQGRLFLLPDYGARGVADQLPGWRVLRTAPVSPALVTWLEYDGSMFLPQAWTRALHDGAAAAWALPFTAVYANHWRVSGVEPEAWMFAATAWRPRPYMEMMSSYLGAVYGPGAAARALGAQEALEKATVYVRQHLFNVAFSWETYRHRPYPAAERDHAGTLFLEAALSFSLLADRAETEEGRRRAARLADRCRAAAIHLHAVQSLARALEASETAATPAELEAAATHAARAEREGGEYLRVYARHVVDRGDQGMLVSYHYSVVGRARRLADDLRRRAEAARR